MNGRVFSWNSGGWQESGHLASPADDSWGSETRVTYGATNPAAMQVVQLVAMPIADALVSWLGRGQARV